MYLLAFSGPIEREFLFDGGLSTNCIRTGEQWDEPYDWAPLHWMAVIGFERYDHTRLAETIATRWLSLNRSVFEDTGGMAEKYDVVENSLADDAGEYDVQFGFGWTNGVATALASRFNL